jgi:hypothetical protein
MAQKAYEPTDKDRNIVKIAKAAGCKEESIAKMLSIDLKTLKKYYRDDLDHGTDELTRNVAGALYKNAIGGNVTAQIFWLKTRAGWRETEIHEQAELLPTLKAKTHTPRRLSDKPKKPD